MSETVGYTIGWITPPPSCTGSRSRRARAASRSCSPPAWRPGRYIVQNYSANVQNVRAVDEGGNPLPAEWIDLDSWRVDPGSARSVTLQYEYYARTFDAGSSTLTPTPRTSIR